ncbi:MAG: hypothetical protein GKR88_04490 [Flavobacteriaceae bacterium]|nr:MAG: hypothetical protein GKR88_04490 [Flavobacteriaceae bacterium]
MAQKFKYNGVELEESLGLDLYEMEVRMYDPAIARFTSVDPVIHFEYSPYQAFDNNPIFWADPSGADAISDFFDTNKVTEEDYWNNYYTQLHEEIITLYGGTTDNSNGNNDDENDSETEEDCCNQQIMRPDKISLSKSKEEVLGSFIQWFHFIDNTTDSDRGVLILDDIINYEQSKRKKGIAERWFGMGSMIGYVVKKYYKDSGGSMIMSFDEGLKGKSSEMYQISVVRSQNSGGNGKGDFIYYYSVKLKGGGNALTMRINGKDLFNRVYRAVQQGGFFEKKNAKN